MELSIAELEERLSDLRARLPRHSAPAAMLQELEELEEALAACRQLENEMINREV